MLIGISNKESDNTATRKVHLRTCFLFFFFTIDMDIYVCPKDSTQCQEMYTS